VMVSVVIPRRRCQPQKLLLLLGQLEEMPKLRRLRLIWPRFITKPKSLISRRCESVGVGLFFG
jgi:hypothetical protein